MTSRSRKNVDGVTVNGFTRSLNSSCNNTFVATSVIPFGGDTNATVGRTKSAPLSVVNVVLTALNALPARSNTPATSTVCNVFPNKGSDGTSINVRLPFDKLRDTSTSPIPSLTLTPSMLSNCTGSSNSTITRAFLATPDNPSSGLTPDNSGATTSSTNPVVNVVAQLNNALPDRSVIPVPRIILWERPTANGASATNVNVLPSALTPRMPDTSCRVVLSCNLKLTSFTVPGSTGSSTSNVTTTFNGISNALCSGLAATILGLTMSLKSDVVKAESNTPSIRLPAKSRTPCTWIV